MTVWFTADHHLDHANILRYTERHLVWNNVDEMNEGLIERWNEKIGILDDVYYLSDFSLGKDVDKYFVRLNGNIHVLLTNWHHDKRWLEVFSPHYSANGNNVDYLPPLHVLFFDNYPPITLCHYPMYSWERSHYGAWHLFGHVHGRFAGVGLSIDVGVDARNYYPVSLEEVALVMKTKTIAQHDRIKREEI